jgi:DNA-3-methyladenine glycosylase II
METMYSDTATVAAYRPARNRPDARSSTGTLAVMPATRGRTPSAGPGHATADDGAPVSGPSRVSLTKAIDEVAGRDPVLARLVEQAGRIRHRPRGSDGPFGSLVRAITFQQLAGPAANAIHNRFRALIDGRLTPAAVLELPDEALRAAGLSGAKAASIRDLSAKVLDGTVVLGPTPLPDEEIIARLSTVRGIGRWTSEMYLMFELRRLDVWPVDDLGVRQGYGAAWSIDPPPTAKQLQPLGDRFRPYRSVVARYCWEAAVLESGTATNLR